MKRILYTVQNLSTAPNNIKKRSLKIICFTCLSLLPSLQAFASIEKFSLDPINSYVEWHIKHFGYSSSSGKISTSGTLALDRQHPEKSQVNITVKLKNILTGIPELDEQLKSKLFFNAKKFPIATFTSTSVEATQNETAKIHGILTLHGISKPITIYVALNRLGESPDSHNMRAGFSGVAEIKRSNFNIKTLLPELGDQVILNIEAEAIKKSDAIPPMRLTKSSTAKKKIHPKGKPYKIKNTQINFYSGWTFNTLKPKSFTLPAIADQLYTKIETPRARKLIAKENTNTDSNLILAKSNKLPEANIDEHKSQHSKKEFIVKWLNDLFDNNTKKQPNPSSNHTKNPIVAKNIKKNIHNKPAIKPKKKITLNKENHVITALNKKKPTINKNSKKTHSSQKQILIKQIKKEITHKKQKLGSTKNKTINKRNDSLNSIYTLKPSKKKFYTAWAYKYTSNQPSNPNIKHIGKKTHVLKNNLPKQIIKASSINNRVYALKANKKQFFKSWTQSFIKTNFIKNNNHSILHKPDHHTKSRVISKHKTNKHIKKFNKNTSQTHVSNLYTLKPGTKDFYAEWTLEYIENHSFS